MPYVVHMEPEFEPLQRMDVPELAERVTDAWSNQTLCRVDESFHVVDGHLTVEVEDSDPIELRAGQA